MTKKNKKKNKKKNITFKDNIERYIKIYDNVISDDLCDEIVEEYKKSDEWKNSSVNELYCVAKGDYDIINISDANIILNNIEKRKKHDNLIYDSIFNIRELYTKEFKCFYTEYDTGFELIRYKKDQFHEQNINYFKNGQRVVTCIIYLNDNYDGGELSFFDGEKILKCKKGSTLVFPSNFMYPYQTMSVLKGTKYSIQTWLV
jgi:hypothetical protein